MAKRPAIAGARRGDANAEYERRRSAREWRSWYGLARWKLIRADQLAREPLCCMCLEDGVATAATVCDHVDRHRGDPVKFWNGPFQSLCAPHHDREKQIEEAKAGGWQKSSPLPPRPVT